MNIWFIRHSCRDTIRHIMSNMTNRAGVAANLNLPMVNGLAIRWGNGKPVDADVEINRMAGKRSKTTHRNIMLRRGVACPPPPDSEYDTRAYVIRPDHHHGGKNLHLGNGRDAFRMIRNGGYAGLLIDKVAEYRVHIGHGKVLLINTKALLEGEICANHAVTDLPWTAMRFEDYPVELCRLACRAINALDLDFGAVDVMQGRDGNYWVCEVNTAPSLSTPLDGQKYGRYMDWIIDHYKATGRAPMAWKGDAYEKAKSFCWNSFAYEHYPVDGGVCKKEELSR